MKITEIKSVNITYETQDNNTLNKSAELLDELITTMSNNNCDTLIGTDYNGDIAISILDLQSAKRVLENISSTEEMI